MASGDMTVLETCQHVVQQMLMCLLKRAFKVAWHGLGYMVQW
jgi:hypothetical protein